MPDSCAKALAPTTALLGEQPKLMNSASMLAGWVELLHLDVVGVGQLVAADHEGGGDLFESGVAGALADAVDGALDLACAGLNAGEGVGDGHAEIVVAVGGEDDVLGARNLCEQHAEGGGVLVGRGVADGVGDVDGGRSGLDGDGDDLDEEVGVGAGGVFGGELDVVGEGAGEADGFGGLIEGLGAGDLQLGLEMQVGGGEEGVDADFAAGSTARAAASMSSRLQRAREAMRAPRTSRAIVRMESESPWLAMAKPASMTSTPRSAS